MLNILLGFQVPLISQQYPGCQHAYTEALISSVEGWFIEGQIMGHDNAIMFPAIKVTFTHHTNYHDRTTFTSTHFNAETSSVPWPF